MERFVHAGDVNRTKKDYQSGLDRLDQWLRRSEDLLATPQKVESANIRKILETLVGLHSEVGDMEEVFKDVSKKFGRLAQVL